MDKKILTFYKCFGYIALVVVAFILGLQINTPMREEFYQLQEANEFKYEAIILNDSLMKYADKVMDENCLWDIDGSDNMAKYLEFHEKIDSLYDTQL